MSPNPSLKVQARRVTASTPLRLKAAVRKRMGWPDRRTWTAEEWAQVNRLFVFQIDHKRAVFEAIPVASLEATS